MQQGGLGEYRVRWPSTLIEAVLRMGFVGGRKGFWGVCLFESTIAEHADRPFRVRPDGVVRVALAHIQ